MSRIDNRLQELGIRLPAAPAPAANYVPYVVEGTLVFVSGQVPFENGKLAFQGKVGRDFSLEEGQQAARLCALGVLAQAREACGGDLDRVRRCVQLQGFVNSADDFAQQPAVINAASDLMVDVLGDAGRHARFAVGSNVLPFDVAVEIAAIFAISG